jgi:hypothetical protein
MWSVSARADRNGIRDGDARRRHDERVCDSRHCIANRPNGPDAHPYGKATQNGREGSNSPEVISYVLTSSHALRSRDGSGSAVPTAGLSGPLRLTIPVSSGNEQWHQTQSTETELYGQWYLRQQQGRDSKASRELLGSASRGHRTMPRWELQLQSEPTWHVFPPWWRGEVVVKDDGLEGTRKNGRRRITSCLLV